MFIRKTNRGIGLLELMLSLAVIAVLLVMATRFFGVTHRAEELNHAAKDVTFLIAGLENWQGDRSGFKGLSFAAMHSEGLVPDDISEQGMLPVWGGCRSGHVTVTADAANNTAMIAFEGVSRKLCQGLANRFSNHHNSLVMGSHCRDDQMACHARFELTVG